MASSLIRAKYVITTAGTDESSSNVITDGAIFQRDGIIEEVGPYNELKSRHESDEVIGGENFIAFPGLVNAHNHGRIGTGFQMCGCDDSLETWILSGWGRRPFDWYLATLYSAMQMIESGTTTVMYNHTQTPVTGLQDEVDSVLKAFDESGMRTAFSIYFRGQNRVVYDDDETFISGLPSDLANSVRTFLARGSISADEYFSIFETTYQKYGTDPTSRVRVLLSPANVQWASDDFLQRTKEYAVRYNTGIHMHLVETPYQKEYGLRTWGKTPVAHLNDLEFLGSEVSFAHSIWVTDQDIALLGQNRCTICHNPSSNLRLKNGVAPVNSMLDGGVNVAVGTDSTAINDDEDLLQELRLVAKLHREPRIEGRAINSHQVLRLATLNSAAPTFFHDQIGALEKGRRADVVLLDMKHIEEPYLNPDIHVVDALLYRGKAQYVDTVIIDGEVVLRNREFTNINKQDVINELRERYSKPLEQSVQDTRSMVRRLIPHVEKFYQGWQPSEVLPHYLFNSRT